MRNLRNSPWLVASRFVSATKSAVLVAVFVLSLLATVDPQHRRWIFLFLAYYVWTRVYVLFFDFLFLRYELDENGVRSVRQFLRRTVQSIRWEDVASVAISADLVMRAGKCCSVVVVASGGNGAVLKLWCIPNAYAEYIKNCAATKSKIVTGSASSTKADFSIRYQLSNLSKVDCFLLSLFHLYFLPLIPMAFTWIRYLTLDRSYSESYRDNIFFFRHLNPSVQLEVGVLVGVFTIILGALVAWVRFGNSNTVFDNNYVEFNSGFFNRQGQRIPKRNLRTIVLRQNLAMVVLKHYAISASGISALGQQKSAGLIAPFAAQEQVDVILETIKADSLHRMTLRKRTWSRIAVLILALACVGVEPLSLPLCFLLMGVTIAIWVWFARWRLSTTSSDAVPWVSFERGLFSRKIILISTRDQYAYSQFSVSAFGKICAGYFRVTFLGSVRSVLYVLFVGPWKEFYGPLQNLKIKNAID